MIAAENPQKKLSGWLIGGIIAGAGYSFFSILTAAIAAHASWNITGPESDLGTTMLFAYTHPLSLFLQSVLPSHNFAFFILGEVACIAIAFFIGATIGQQMRKGYASKYFSVGIILILVLIVGAVDYYYFGPYPERCQKFNQDYMRNGCYRDLAVLDHDVSLCNKISKAEVRDLCHSNIASQEEDQAGCNAIVNADDRVECAAIANRDASMCLQLPENSLSSAGAMHAGIQSECVSTIAMLKKDPSLCEIIPDSIQKNNCYGTVYYSSH